MFYFLKIDEKEYFLAKLFSGDVSLVMKNQISVNFKFWILILKV